MMCWRLTLSCSQRETSEAYVKNKLKVVKVFKSGKGGGETGMRTQRIQSIVVDAIWRNATLQIVLRRENGCTVIKTGLANVEALFINRPKRRCCCVSKEGKE